MGWELRIRDSVSIDRQRRRQTHPETDIDTLDRHPSTEEDNDCRTERIAEVNRLIEAHLSARDRDILRRHDRDGWDFDEIADHFGITPANARMIVSRARKTIRTLYRDRGG